MPRSNGDPSLSPFTLNPSLKTSVSTHRLFPWSSRIFTKYVSYRNRYCVQCICVLVSYDCNTKELVQQGIVKHIVELSNPKDELMSTWCAFAFHVLSCHPECLDDASNSDIVKALVELCEVRTRTRGHSNAISPSLLPCPLSVLRSSFQSFHCPNLPPHTIFCAYI